MKKIAILQSNYIPWKGYFDLIASVDEFVIYDDMQYTRRDWRNRNKIKTAQGLRWLTVPVKVKGKYFQKIKDTEINDPEWPQQHWNVLEINYRKAEFFKEISEWLKPLYAKCFLPTITEVNLLFIKSICDYLSIQTHITPPGHYKLIEGKTSRLIEICKQAGAHEYISGPSAQDYIDEELFEKNGIKLTWFDYSGYSEYPQLWGEFEHGVTILDLLFNCGRKAGHYMKFVDSL
jgi:hypothetical protein